MMRKSLLLSILAITIIAFLVGCSEKKGDSLNKSMIITDDVKNDTEQELKVISTEEFIFDEVIECFTFRPIEKDDGSTLIRITSGNDVGKNVVAKINGDRVSIIEKKYIDQNQSLGAGKAFDVEELDSNKVRISNWYTDEKYEIEKSLISNDDSRYVLLNDYLVEFVGEDQWSFVTDEIAWINLNTGVSGRIEMPKDLDSALYADIIDDKLFIATTSLVACEEYNKKLENDFVGYLLPDTLFVIDLKNNEVSDKVTIGSFLEFKVVDSDRIIFILDNRENDIIEFNVVMYSLNNKIKKELIKYSNEQGEEFINFNGIEVFPSRDKIFYCEDNGETLSLKIAEINAMEIENVITAYELNNFNPQGFTADSISFGNDGRELNIYRRKFDGSEVGIDKLIKIRLNK